MRLTFHWVFILSLKFAVLSVGADDKETTNDLANEIHSGNDINILNYPK